MTNSKKIDNNQIRGQFCMVATALRIKDRSSLSSHEHKVLITTGFIFATIFIWLLIP